MPIRILGQGDYITGHPYHNHVLEQVAECLRDVISRYNGCKIGETSDVAERSKAYRRDGFAYFFIIYQSTSYRYVDEMEDIFNHEFFDYTLNEKRGSAGQMAEGQPLYTLYCAARSVRSLPRTVLTASEQSRTP